MSENKTKKAYRKPQLQELGDLRSLTLGGSPGTFDSGTSRSRKPIGGVPQPGGFPGQQPNTQPGRVPPSGATGL